MIYTYNDKTNKINIKVFNKNLAELIDAKNNTKEGIKKSDWLNFIATGQVQINCQVDKLPNKVTKYTIKN